MRAAPVVLAAALLLVAPGSAAADVIFDPADADELVAVLAEATQTQNVCYGWRVTVDDVGAVSESVGSNAGAGTPATSGSCTATVEFTANITYTSESSESEDSASYDVVSSPGGPTKADLDALGIDFDGLTGEDPDVVVGKAVTALPLLAADAGLAQPIEAAPETGTAPADAQLTDDPGSDWWRANLGTLTWALILMAAGGVFAWAVLRGHRRSRRRVHAAAPLEEMPEPDWVPPYVPETDPDPATKPSQEQPREEPPTEEQAASAPDESTVDELAAPADQKDKE